MGIDGIGKGGALPPTPDAHGAASVEKKGQVERAFSVERPDAAKEASSAARAAEATQASTLDRLRAGEIDLDGYLDRKVEDATRDLTGLSSAELADVKQIVREQLVTDPGLADLVRAATGHAPTPPEE